MMGQKEQFEQAQKAQTTNASEWKEAGPGTLINTGAGEKKTGTLPPEQQSFDSYMLNVPGARPDQYPSWKAGQEANATIPAAVAKARLEAQATLPFKAQEAANAARSFSRLSNGSAEGGAGKMLAQRIVAPSEIAARSNPSLPGAS